MNFYEYLGVQSTASPDEIRKAFRNLAKKKHPDYNKTDGAFWEMVELNLIRDTLLNPEKRAVYDISLTKEDALPTTATPHQTSKKTSRFHKMAHAVSAVQSFFTFRCQICSVELRSTWRGYCLYHYLEVSGQLDNPNFVFEYAGYTYQWADPPEFVKNRTKQSPKHTPSSIKITAAHLALYVILISLLCLTLMLYIHSFLSRNGIRVQ
jgi:curved DNA-binding protein CbpA